MYLAKTTHSFNFEQLHEYVFKWLTNIDIITNTRYVYAYCIKQDWNREYLSSSPVLIGVRVVRSLVFCVIICRSLFVLLADLSKWHRKNWHYINWKKRHEAYCGIQWRNNLTFFRRLILYMTPISETEIFLFVCQNFSSSRYFVL